MRTRSNRDRPFELVSEVLWISIVGTSVVWDADMCECTGASDVCPSGMLKPREEAVAFGSAVCRKTESIATERVKCQKGILLAVTGSQKAPPAQQVSPSPHGSGGHCCSCAVQEEHKEGQTCRGHS